MKETMMQEVTMKDMVKDIINNAVGNGLLTVYEFPYFVLARSEGTREFEITEWDDTKAVVQACFTGDIEMEYNDGTVHTVTPWYFFREIKAVPTKIISAHPGLTTPKVSKVEFVRDRYTETAMAELSDGSIVDLFTYYPDELYFDSAELIGKTVEQCEKVRFNKDVAYLRS